MSRFIHSTGTKSTADPKSMQALYVPGIMVLVSVALLLFAFVMAFRSATLYDEGVRTVGTVVDVQRRESRDSDGRRRVSYTSQVRFSTSQGLVTTVNISNNHTVGESIKLVYPPNAPHEAKKDSFGALWGVPIVAGVIAIVLLLIGVILGCRAYKRKQEIEWLYQHGQRVAARVTGVNKETRQHRSSSHVSIGSSSHYRPRYRTQTTYQIVSQGDHPSTGHNLQFVSHPLGRDPGNHIVGSSVDVLVHPTNPRVYYVEVSSVGRGSAASSSAIDSLV